MSEQTKRISWEEVRNIVAANKSKGDKAFIAAAMVAMREGPMPVTFDPKLPFALQIRHPQKDGEPELGWSVHPWRFPDVFSAGKAAKDLRKLDSRLEVRICKAAGN